MKLPARPLQRRLLAPPKPTIPVPGSHLMPARLPDVRRVLADLEAADLAALDPEFGAWMQRPLGREALAGVVLPSAGSLFVAVLNIDPAGLILLERGATAAQIRVLAIAPDLRKRGLAQSVLALAEREAAARDLAWLWMLIAPGNTLATRCALRAGYRRVQPQYLHRALKRGLALTNLSARFALLSEREALAEASRWIAYECALGDAWCADLVHSDLIKLLAPNEGSVYRCIVDERDAGLLHVEWTAASHLRLRLWLEQRLWGTAQEREIFKGALDMLADRPDVIDLEFGSSQHLRTALEQFRPLGFEPAQFERVTFAKRVSALQQLGDNEHEEIN
jgi:GNAT superfamily N-acetyltransferase